MNCDLAQQKIALYGYGELPDDQCHELEGHLATCQRCQEELVAIQALQQAMALAPNPEPSANLLAQARLRLEEALDSMPRSGWIMRVQESMFRGVSMLARTPVAASALLVFGLACGGTAGYEAAEHAHPAVKTATSPAPVLKPENVADVTSIVREPNSENVEVRFDRRAPETFHGSLDDQQVRDLLLAGVQSPDPGVARESMRLLADECEAKHQCPEGAIRDYLMVALRFDRDPKVRLTALNGLKPYVAEDVRVRDAILESLMTDPDAAIRSHAIELLQPVQADSSVQEVLQTVATADDNPHIRTVSREVLETQTHFQ
jgi:anti-sigma factor RsiW